MDTLVMRLRGALNLRMLVTLVMLGAAASAFATGTGAGSTGEITQEDFTALATQILTYLGYSIVAGLSVLVAVIGARRAWSFMRRFL